MKENPFARLRCKMGSFLLYPKKNRKNPLKYDKELYKRRNEVERYFLRLKRFRKVFTRYDKLDCIYFSVVQLAMIFDALF